MKMMEEEEERRKRLVNGAKVLILKDLILACSCLVLLTTSCAIFGTALFLTEGAPQITSKCGVHRVKRNFLSDLWSESQTSDEDLWKSSARKHLSQFEQQLYSAIQDSAFLTRGSGIHLRGGSMDWFPAEKAVFNVWKVSTSLPDHGVWTSGSSIGGCLVMLSNLVGLPLYSGMVITLARLISMTIRILPLSFQFSCGQESVSSTFNSSQREKEVVLKGDNDIKGTQMRPASPTTLNNNNIPFVPSTAISGEGFHFSIFKSISGILMIPPTSDLSEPLPLTFSFVLMLIYNFGISAILLLVKKTFKEEFMLLDVCNSIMVGAITFTFASSVQAYLNGWIETVVKKKATGA